MHHPCLDQSHNESLSFSRWTRVLEQMKILPRHAQLFSELDILFLSSNKGL